MLDEILSKTIPVQIFQSNFLKYIFKKYDWKIWAGIFPPLSVTCLAQLTLLQLILRKVQIVEPLTVVRQLSVYFRPTLSSCKNVTETAGFIKCGKFIGSWPNISFSRWTLFHASGRLVGQSVDRYEGRPPVDGWLADRLLHVFDCLVG